MAAYVEDGLAGVIRCAAEFGMIPGVDAQRVYTDENAENEWQGEDKVYVLRGEQKPVYDLASPTGNAHCTIGEFALVALSGDRADAQRLAVSVWDAVLLKFSDETWSAEYAGSEPVGFVDEVKECASLLRISEDSECFLSAGDQWKASAFDFTGTVTGGGQWIGGALFAESALASGTAPSWTFKTSRLGVVSWIYDRYNTVPRADGGAYSDEWFSTHSIRTVYLN